MFSRADDCSQGTIPNSTPTEVELIWLRWLGCSVHRRLIFRFFVGDEVVSSSRKVVSQDKLNMGVACKAYFVIQQLGQFCGGIPVPEYVPIEERETTLKEDDEADREAFLRLMRKMLQWDPERRSSAKELSEDEWIERHTRLWIVYDIDVELGSFKGVELEGKTFWSSIDCVSSDGVDIFKCGTTMGNLVMIRTYFST